MIKSSNHKKGVMVGVIVALVLVVSLGVTFAIWNYSRTTDNQILVAGDIYMKFTETNSLTIENALPSEGPGVNDYFEFTIEGKNTYSKPIWYEIDLQHGEPHDTRGTRIEDDLLLFKLVEVKEDDQGEEQEEVLIEKGSYTGLATGKGIYVNTIPAGTNTKITKTYRLYMWISSETIIGNTSDADYDMDEWNDVYASIKVNVTGDFNEKIVEKEIKYGIATETIKDRLGQPGGVIGVTNENTPTKTENGNIREYRYSGLSVSNYIYFNCSEGTTYETASSNCEKWRIIGIFKDDSGNEHLKIVRDNVLTRDMFPETYTISGITYKIQYEYSEDSAYWHYKTNGTYNNDWATAGLQYWLNTEEDETAEEPNKGYLSTLKDNTLSMIEETKYYLGSMYYDDDTIASYAHERATECADGKGPRENSSMTAVEGNTACRVWANNQATLTGKIALLYPSDYGFTADSTYWTGTTLYNYDSEASDTSWLQQTANHSDFEWLLSPSSIASNNVANWPTSGRVGPAGLNRNHGVRPSVNLISDIKITQGDGSLTTPYFLEF